eukprot:contig_27041_g6652
MASWVDLFFAVRSSHALLRLACGVLAVVRGDCRSPVMDRLYYSTLAKGRIG